MDAPGAHSWEEIGAGAPCQHHLALSKPNQILRISLQFYHKCIVATNVRTSARVRHRNGLANGGQCVLFSVVFTPPLPSHQGSTWLLHIIFLLLTNSLSPVWACPSYDQRGFVGAKKRRSWASKNSILSGTSSTTLYKNPH
jgi:hypothetical protein